MFYEAKRPKILCVDDDPLTADWIAAVLARANVACEVVRADKGRDAFGQLVANDVDLCVLEYALPDMTGVQLCGLVRQVGGKVPVLFFTPMNRDIDRNLAFGAGADEYLTKPDDLDIFADAVSCLLNRRRPIYVRRPPERQYALAA